MPVVLSSRLRRRWISLSGVHSLAENILKAAGASRSDLSLLLVGDRAMRRLNRRYRRKDRTTDVLAFPVRKHSARPVPRASRLVPALLGDIVISLPQAERQAKRAGHTLEREVAVLIAHGLLHLMGYDHERSAREARRMSLRERAIARALRLHA
ncbi:MAG: rRNA maturation RNase YbeY [Nitrospiraceae bacterium]|nr:rRNA maturation RNase YbeY [Nitrospiraceae bacterium]